MPSLILLQLWLDSVKRNGTQGPLYLHVRRSASCFSESLVRKQCLGHWSVTGSPGYENSCEVCTKAMLQREVSHAQKEKIMLQSEDQAGPPYFTKQTAKEHLQDISVSFITRPTNISL